MATLWQRLGAILGAKFTNQYGPVGGVAFKTWSLLLRNLSGEQIKNGIDRYMASDDQFIDAKKFKALCEKKPETQQSINWQAYKPYQKPKQLVDKSAKERAERAREHFIKQIKEKVK